MNNQPLNPGRRRLLTHAGSALSVSGLAMTGLLPGAALATAGSRWQNWSGNQTAQPGAVFYPQNEAELVQVVKNAKPPLRAFGGGHSFAPLVPSTGTLLSLEQMTALVRHDPQAVTATLTGGTRIAVAGELMAAIGQNFYNEPDINMQSVAGAISTATHGTGASLQCLSAYVTELKLVLADGSVVTCSAGQDRELFEAARVSLGSIGIISEITFRNLPAYKLAVTNKVMDIAEAMAFIEQRKDLDRHIEFFAFPFGGKALVEQTNFTTEPDTPAEEPSWLDENRLLQLAADTVKTAPFAKGVIQKLLGAFVTEKRVVGPAHRIFPAPRTVHFNEMEYTVPAARGLECLQEVIDTIRRHDFPVFFPIEYRYTAADDTWLSPFSQRAGASISIHQYAEQDYREVFAAVEPVLKKYGGRPHWGKLHTLVARDLQALYPRLPDYLAVRRRVDPQGKLLNPYMKTLLGV